MLQNIILLCSYRMYWISKMRACVTFVFTHGKWRGSRAKRIPLPVVQDWRWDVTDWRTKCFYYRTELLNQVVIILMHKTLWTKSWSECSGFIVRFSYNSRLIKFDLTRSLYHRAAWTAGTADTPTLQSYHLIFFYLEYISVYIANVGAMVSFYTPTA